MTPAAVSAHRLLASYDCDEPTCEEDGRPRPDGRIVCDRHAAPATRRRAANGSAPRTDEPEPELEGTAELEPADGLAGRVCSWTGCEAPAAGTWGKGVICSEHRAELNSRVSAGKRKASRAVREAAAKRKRCEPEPVDERELVPIARRLLPAARRVDHAAQAYREAHRRTCEAERELEAARDGWRDLLEQVDAQAEDVPAGDRC